MRQRRDLVLAILVVYAMICAAQPVYGAVIFSSCPVESQVPGEGTIDRFRAEGLSSSLRNFSQEIPRLGRYLRWLFITKEELAKNRATFLENDQQLKEMGRLLEDLQFAASLATGQGQPCKLSAQPKTLPFAIFPFVMRNRDTQDVINYKIRYKFCEYYVDRKRQLPIDNACIILGRESGYTFAELEARLTQLKNRVEEAREGVKLATYGAGALASLTTFRVLRLLKAGRLSAAALSLLPAGGAFMAVQNGLSDEVIRNVIDFQDAAEVAVTGDLGSTVQVDMPIQDFAPFFARYLEGIDIVPPPFLR